jgi:hypothetical protein
MKEIILSTSSLMIMSIGLHAGGATVPEAVATPPSNHFIKTVEGYVRFGYQHDNHSHTDLALGGKLHIETQSWNGISMGASFYTTNVIGGKNEGAGYPFFDANNHAYSLLGEAYLQGKWGNSMLKIGRMENDTPFEDTDDLAMIKNTYESIVFTNKDIADTTIYLSHTQRMAGVDSSQGEPSKFRDITNDNGIQIAGITYEGIEGLTLSSWYYRLNKYTIDTIAYFEASYENSFNDFNYTLGAQYTSQGHNIGETASAYGLLASVGFKPAGIALSAAYNRSYDNEITVGFGGGPLFTSSEHLTVVESGIEGEALLLGATLDAGIIGIEGLSLSVGKLTLTDTTGTHSDELDITLSYAFNDNLSIDAIYSDVDDTINADAFKNSRVFINYSF